MYLFLTLFFLDPLPYPPPFSMVLLSSERNASGKVRLATAKTEKRSARNNPGKARGRRNKKKREMLEQKKTERKKTASLIIYEWSYFLRV